MQRPTVLLAAALLALGAGCGKSGDGTFVVVTVQPGAGIAPPDLQEIALGLTLEGKTQKVSFPGPAGKPISLPTDLALEIRSGAGNLDLDASARVLGQEVGGGRATGHKVVRGSTTRLTIRIDFPRAATGASSDAGTPGAGRDAIGSVSLDGAANPPDGANTSGGAGMDGSVNDLAPGGPATDATSSAETPRLDASLGDATSGRGDMISLPSVDGAAAGGGDAAATSDVPVDAPTDPDAGAPGLGETGAPLGDGGGAEVPSLDVGPVDQAAGDGAGANDAGDASAAGDAADDSSAALDGASDAQPDAALFPVLMIDKTTNDFGQVVVGGMSGPATLNVHNTGTAATGPLSTMLGGTNPGEFTITSDGCATVVLQPNGMCAVIVRLTPTMPGAPTATLSISGMPGGMVSAALSGTAVTPGALRITPAMQVYTSILVGQTMDVPFTVTNTGGTDTGTITMSLAGTDKDHFSLVNGMDGCTGQTLVPNATCMVTVRFAPTTRGAKAASLTADATPGGSGSTALSGTGLAPAALAFMPANQDYGQVDVGASSTKTFTLRNTGDETSGVPTVMITGAGFTIPTGGNGCTAALAANATCAVDVRFDPATYNVKSGTLSAMATPGGLAQSSLMGTGRDTFTLTVMKTGTGTGTVVSGEGSPTISCGGTCAGPYARTTADPMVTLTATPDVSSTFMGWTGCTMATGPVCDVTLSASKTVTATFVIKTFTLTVTRTETGGATGQVKSTGNTVPAVDCGSTCMVTYDYGTMVTLDATPTQHSFGGWTDDCAGFDGCTLTMTANRTVGAKFGPANRAFVTSMAYPIAYLRTQGSGATDALKLLSGADAICNSTAAAGVPALPGTYVAYVTRNGVNVSSRVGAARGWIRPDGRPFTDTLASAMAGQTMYPAALDEYGATGDGWDVLTGAAMDGSAHPNTCSDWSVVDSSRQARVGVRGAGSHIWGSYYDLGCDQSFRLLCLGVDHTVKVTVPAPPMNKRILFVTSTAFTPSPGGLPAADMSCTISAAIGGLSGTFKAMLATTTGSIASRFTTTGVPVVRPDGVWVSATDTDLLSMTPTLLAPIVVQANGTTHWGGNVWTGSNTPTTAASGDNGSCTSWTSSNPALGGVSGSNAFLANSIRWLNEGTPGCNAGLRLYCLQTP